MKKICIFFVFLCLTASPALAGAGAVDLRAFASSAGLDYSFDPVSKIATVNGGKSRVRFVVGSEYGLADERLWRLSDRARFQNDSVWVPVMAREFLQKLAPAVVHRIRKVVIDAGHGGTDSGAVSPYGFKEKRVALEVARKVRSSLEARGLEVVMTRSSDVFIPLAERANIANKARADFFVSIHANAATTHSLNGFEVYYLSEATDDAALAVERAENSVIRFESSRVPAMDKGLKTIVWDLHEAENRKESLRIVDHVIASVKDSVVTAARRALSANFYVLKWTECPAVLVELGYLTNKADERKLRNPAYKTDMAEAIVRGIWSYKLEYEATDGFTK